mgnify:CR=1 FL=1
MSKRSLQKEKTNQRILFVTREIYLDQGYIATSTKRISDQAKVSQGTVFLHFKTKEKLLKKIIVEELLTLKEQLEFTELNLSSLFRLVEDHEEILSRVIKDYPYLPSSFQEVFDQLKSSLKDHLFDILKETSNQSILDLFAFIDLLLALLFEDLFYSREKILSTRKKKYKQMIQKFT